MPYAVKQGKRTVSCHRLKRAALKKQKAMKHAGKSARIVKRKSCK